MAVICPPINDTMLIWKIGYDNPRMSYRIRSPVCLPPNTRAIYGITANAIGYLVLHLSAL